MPPTDGCYLIIVVNGLEVHMAGPPLQALMEAFKDSDVLDGELVIDYLDGQYHTLPHPFPAPS